MRRPGRCSRRGPGGRCSRRPVARDGLEDRRADRHDHEQDDEERAEERDAIALEAPPRDLPRAARVDDRLARTYTLGNVDDRRSRRRQLPRPFTDRQSGPPNDSGPHPEGRTIAPSVPGRLPHEEPDRRTLAERSDSMRRCMEMHHALAPCAGGNVSRHSDAGTVESCADMAPVTRFAIDPRGPFSLARAAGFLGAFPPLGHGGARRGRRAADRVPARRRRGRGRRGAAPARGGRPGRRSSWRARATRTTCAPRSSASSRWTPTRRPSAGVLAARPGRGRGDRGPARACARCYSRRPYEAAAWAVLSARQQLAQASAIRARLVEEQGETVAVDGRELRTFPPPGNLLQVRRIGGGQALERLRRLHAVAEAALLGELDPDVLRDGPEDEALRRLTRIRGIGPYGAGLVLARGDGPDRRPAGERAARPQGRGAALPREPEGRRRVQEDRRAVAPVPDVGLLPAAERGVGRLVGRRGRPKPAEGGQLSNRGTGQCPTRRPFTRVRSAWRAAAHGVLTTKHECLVRSCGHDSGRLRAPKSAAPPAKCPTPAPHNGQGRTGLPYGSPGTPKLGAASGSNARRT